MLLTYTQKLFLGGFTLGALRCLAVHWFKTPSGGKAGFTPPSPFHISLSEGY